MPNRTRTAIAAGLFVTAMAVAGAAQTGAPPQTPPDPKPRPDLVRYPYNAADAAFVQGMIPHHAQAVLIAGWAPSHGASKVMQLMCERMVVSQKDEIEWMRNWLRDRGEYVPARDATHHKMKMAGGMEHDMLMPGMLSDDELKQLDKARGPEWDKLFLQFMIKHHEGALKMVDDLFNSHGALQDEDLYAFASDIFADQTAEIERMQKMLAGGK
jgi:uncharacterized protein (DUF305 family)